VVVRSRAQHVRGRDDRFEHLSGRDEAVLQIETFGEPQHQFDPFATVQRSRVDQSQGAARLLQVNVGRRLTEALEQDAPQDDSGAVLGGRHSCGRPCSPLGIVVRRRVVKTPRLTQRILRIQRALRQKEGCEESSEAAHALDGSTAVRDH
jgi:hypothetical protein